MGTVSLKRDATILMIRGLLDSNSLVIDEKVCLGHVEGSRSAPPNVLNRLLRRSSSEFNKGDCNQNGSSIVGLIMYNWLTFRVLPGSVLRFWAATLALSHR